MPGLIGFVAPFDGDARQTGSPTEQERIAAMARALEPGGGFRTDLFAAPGVGLGRVGLEWLQPASQPVWDPSVAICVVMEGELYNRAELAALLPSDERVGPKTAEPRPMSDADLLLSLFRAKGSAFARHVNGAYAAAFWDPANRQLTLINDRLGLYPLYWAEVGGSLLFASGVRALLSDPGLPRRIDALAIEQFLTFDHVLGTCTLLEDVQLLSPGSIMTWQEGRRQQQSYWQPRHPTSYALRPETDWMDGLIHHLRQAVRRQAPSGDRSGILLSGGLDSRVILAFLAEDGPPRGFTALTFGIPGCDDVRYAEALARVAKVPHYFYELKPDWLLHLADEAVRLTDGLGNIVNMHALATARQESQQARVVYKGFLGDAMMGFGLRHFHWARYAADQIAEAHMQTLRDRGVVTFDTHERRELLSEPFQAHVGDGLMQSYAAVMAESDSPDLADQRIVYDFRQRVPRMTLNGVEALRGHVLVRMPFADNDLVEYSLAIPPGLRYERRLIKNAFIRDFPAYAQITSTETGLPLMDNLTTVRRQAENWTRWHVRRVVKGVRYPHHRPYKDYANWFRAGLRPWIEGTLLERRALERGYFKPETVRRLVAQHMAGANHTVQLGALMTIELWHRQFIDRNGMKE
jgi:asparagine synthase (glutamine-hydrolysing)